MPISQLNLSLNEFMNLSENNPNTLYFMDFMADWCGPCKMIKPYIHDLSEQFENKDVQFYMVKSDDSEMEELVEYFNITALPTFVLFKNKNILTTIVGVDKEKVRESIQRYLS